MAACIEQGTETASALICTSGTDIQCVRYV